jgi:hypothetical protein
MFRLKHLTSGWTIAVALWAAVVGVGGTWLWKYAATAGVAATPPEHWPARSAIVREAGRVTLVMLAHPRCPCTRASIAELAVLMDRIGAQASAHVLFVQPRGVRPGDGWAKTALWQSVAGIPGVTVHADAGGAEAALFHAVTSGQVVAYDASGKLVFSGGITGARGHEGDNVGLMRALALVSGRRADRNESKVFGCALGSRVEPKGEGTP